MDPSKLDPLVMHSAEDGLRITNAEKQIRVMMSCCVVINSYCSPASLPATVALCIHEGEESERGAELASGGERSYEQSQMLGGRVRGKEQEQ